MTLKSVRVLSLVAVLGVSACGGDDVVNIGDLSEAEIGDLAGAVLSVAFTSVGDVTTFPNAAASGPQATPIELNQSVDVTAPCPLGGDVAVSGSLTVTGDTESEGGRLSFAVTHIHDACVVASENDRQFTLWGNPDLGVEFFVDIDELGMIEWGGDFDGAVDWETDGREGTCTFALTFSGTAQLQSETVSTTMSGTACGAQISQTLNIG